MTTSGRDIQLRRTAAKWLQQLGLSSEPGSLGARFQHGISWNVTGAVFTHGTNFLTSIIIANLIGREAFGKFGIVQSTLLTFAGVAQIATGITATKYVAEFRTSCKERAGRVLGLCSAVTLLTGVFAAVFIVLSSSWLANTTLKAPDLGYELRIAAGAVLFSVMNGYQIGALAGLESYRVLALAGAGQGLFQVAVCSLSTWKWGLDGAIWGLFASALARWFFFHLGLRREAARQCIYPRYSSLWQERQILAGFAIPAAISGISSGPAMWLANAFLVRHPGGYSQLALFSAAFNMKSVVMFLPLLLNNVGMSLLNNQRGAGEEAQYRNVFWMNLKLTGSSVLMGAICVAALGTHLLRLYGTAFTDAYPTLVVLMGAAVIEAIAVAFYQVILSRERMWLSLFMIALPRDAALVVFARFLAPPHGAFGLGLAQFISWLICSVAIFFLAYDLGLNLGHSRLSSRKQHVTSF